MIIVSFDIGLRTCSMACEEYPNEDTLERPKVCYLARTLEATDDMKEYVKKVGEQGRVLHLEKRDLGDKKAFFADHAFRNLYAWCKEMHEHLSRADVVLIEQQMKCNNIALALMHHLQAYLLITYENKKVKLYPSKNKTRVLGAPLKVVEDAKVVKVTKYQRKKWSTMCAEDMLKRRKDDVWYKYIFEKNKSKKDDLSDGLMQTLSYVVQARLDGGGVSSSSVDEVKVKKTRKKKVEDVEQQAEGVVKVKRARKKKVEEVEQQPEAVVKVKRARRKAASV
jgi:hypothetical protein